MSVWKKTCHCTAAKNVNNETTNSQNMASESEFVFHLLYFLFTYCVIYPPKEFIDIGLTTDQICAKILRLRSDDEERQFVQFHQRRTVRNAIIHSFIPFGYISMYTYYYSGGNGGNDEDYTAPADYTLSYFIWKILVILSLALPPVVAAISFYWSWNQWQRHPLSKSLVRYANNNNDGNEQQGWTTVANSVNDEFRRYFQNLV